MEDFIVELASYSHWPFNYLIDIASRAIEILAVVIIVAAVLMSTIQFMSRYFENAGSTESNLKLYRERIGRALLLGLEILVAADVVRTVALEPTMENVLSLGVVVLVRIVLSWSLYVEMNGYLPWKAK